MIRIYVLAYDEASETEALATFGARPWASVVTIPSTPLLEGVAYANVLGEREAEWSACAYVGTLSWRAGTKCPASLEALDVYGAHLPDYDVVPLSSTLVPMLEGSEWYHPGFTHTWTQWLPLIDDSIAPEAVAPPGMLWFPFNYWMARPAVMREYMAFHAKACAALDAPPMQDLVWVDANYGGSMSSKRCEEVFGVPYYPMVPFLLERLPSWYFQWRGKSILWMQ